MPTLHPVAATAHQQRVTAVAAIQHVELRWGPAIVQQVVTQPTVQGVRAGIPAEVVISPPTEQGVVALAAVQDVVAPHCGGWVAVQLVAIERVVALTPIYGVVAQATDHGRVIHPTANHAFAPVCARHVVRDAQLVEAVVGNIPERADHGLDLVDRGHLVGRCCGVPANDLGDHRCVQRRRGQREGDVVAFHIGRQGAVVVEEEMICCFSNWPFEQHGTATITLEDEGISPFATVQDGSAGGDGTDQDVVARASTDTAVADGEHQIVACGASRARWRDRAAGAQRVGRLEEIRGGERTCDGLEVHVHRVHGQCACQVVVAIMDGRVEVQVELVARVGVARIGEIVPGPQVRHRITATQPVAVLVFILEQGVTKFLQLGRRTVEPTGGVYHHGVVEGLDEVDHQRLDRATFDCALDDVLCNAPSGSLKGQDRLVRVDQERGCAEGVCLSILRHGLDVGAVGCQG